MITTVTLNPCIDYTVTLPAFARGELNLAGKARTDMSGKGINVSVVLRELGESTTATGISYTGNHNVLEQHLKNHTIPYEFTLAPGEIRTNVKIIEQENGTHSEINSLGAPVDAVVLTEVAALVSRWAAHSRLMVFSGRIPNGASSDMYAALLSAAQAAGCDTVLDTGGDSLVRGVEQAPTLIKPNELEFFQLTGQSTEDIAITAAASRRLIADKGLCYVCVSLGERGALLSDGDHSYFAPPLSVAVQGVTGAGDSMVAGLCAVLSQGGTTEEMLRYGVAAATATVIRPGTLLCEKKEVDRLLPMVRLQTIQ